MSRLSIWSMIGSCGRSGGGSSETGDDCGWVQGDCGNALSGSCGLEAGDLFSAPLQLWGQAGARSLGFGGKSDCENRIRPLPAKCSFFVGELNIEPHSSQEMMTQVLDTLDDKEISWTVWSYKVAMRGQGGMWGLYRGKKIFPF